MTTTTQTGKGLPLYGGNLETFSLIWLDAQVNNVDENRQAQTQLRQIINYLNIYDNAEHCYQYILSLSEQDRIILVVSGQFGREIVPHIHHLRQLSSIYIYCRDKQGNEQWAKNFLKVKLVATELDSLIQQIKNDQNIRGQVEESISLGISTTTGSINPDQSTTELNGHFVHCLLLLDGLTRMKAQTSDKQELVTFCRNEYKKNKHELKIITDFEKNYAPQHAVFWYTRESFLYRMLNKALRVQNIRVLYLFRFVIRDIYERLKVYRCQAPLVVFRGQFMSNEELNGLRQSVGTVISTQSFISTSRDHRKALSFINSNVAGDLCRVLFIIRADPTRVKSQPFADIQQFSDIAHEAEILFMIGCVFRLTQINFHQIDKIWLIELELFDEREHDEYKLYKHLKAEYGCDGEGEISLYSYGNILVHMGKFDLAEEIFNKLLLLRSQDFSLFDLYYSLALLNKEKKDYDASLNWFNKSLALRLHEPNLDRISIGNLCCCIGNIYKEKNQYERAMECYNQAIQSYRQESALDHRHMAAVYHGQAAIHAEQKNYTEALAFYQRSMDILKVNSLPNHRDRALICDGVGTVYRHLEKFDPALNFYNEALKIRTLSLPSYHPDFSISYKNLGFLWQKRKDWKQSLMYYQKAAEILDRTFASDHPNIIKIKKDILNVKSNIV